MNIDWTELRKQKAWLLAQPGPEAEGLVNLLDALQDEAVGSGVPENTVFGEEVPA